MHYWKLQRKDPRSRIIFIIHSGPDMYILCAIYTSSNFNDVLERFQVLIQTHVSI